ncbi:Transcriptional activator protein ExaE [bioreactor metagenome]|uniref:Transcriptional activator protein ExaE n=1 Tax=bioreactor metagenome TaxID=1076179 RepID=A0A645G446_9ZZZZ
MSTTTILVVDDSRVSRMMSRAFILNKYPDWKIEEAATGEEAIQKMNSITPALVLMDVNMPGMGGVAAAEKLREQYPALRIALQTANIQAAIRAKATAIGAGFLEKPINEARIHQLLTDLGIG